MMRNLSILILIFFTSTLFASNDQKGTWWGTFSKKEIKPGYSWWAETQLRYSNDQGNVGQTLYRTGLLKKSGTLGENGLLYAFIHNNSSKEHRFTAQNSLVYHQSDSLKISHRARLEFRDLEDLNNDGYRFRYLLRFDHQKKYILWNESFLNLNKTTWNGDRAFERNRLFLGLSFKDSLYNIEMGYLNQFVPRSVDVTEHLFVVYLFI